MRDWLEELSVRDLLEPAERIAKAHGITVRTMFSRLRCKSHAAARKAFYTHLRELGWSYPEIGALVGRHHTTILDALGVRGLRPIRGTTQTHMCAEDSSG